MFWFQNYDFYYMSEVTFLGRNNGAIITNRVCHYAFCREFHTLGTIFSSFFKILMIKKRKIHGNCNFDELDFNYCMKTNAIQNVQT